MSLYHETDWMELGEFIRHTSFEKGIAVQSAAMKAAISEKFLASPIFAMRNFFYTVTKEDEFIRQDPWSGQVLLDLCIESQRKRNIAQAVIEIKSRQVGFTQHNIARGFWRTMQPRGVVLMLVNDEDVAEKMMQRVTTFYNNLPKWMMPMKRIDNPKSLVLDNPNSKDRDENPGLASEFLCTVPSAIRGLTPKMFIWSEMAFCKDPNAIFDSVFNSMGANASFCRIIDTTPNGDEDFYKPMAMEACERNPKWVASWERKGAPTREFIINGGLGEPDRPKAGFVPCFMPWHWHQEYTTKDEEKSGQLPCLEPEELQHLKATVGKIEKYGGEEETDLMKRFDISLYRLQWRRWKIDNDTGGADWYEKLGTFRQEHATTYLDCFVPLGHGAFDKRGMDELQRGICPPVARGCMRRDEGGKIYIDRDFHSDWMEVRLWAPPDPGEQYVIGVDGSNAWYSSGGDDTYAQILRRRDLKQVGVMESKAPPDDWREQLRLLYHFFNRAYLGIEMEGVAIDVANKLLRQGVTHQYFYKRPDEDPTKEPSRYIGWETNMKTRFPMQNRLVEKISYRTAEGKPMPQIILRDAKTYTQIMSATRDPQGKIANHGTGHDDAMMALMIALGINDDPWDPYTPKRQVEKAPPSNPIFERYGFPQTVNRNRPKYDML